LAALPHGIKHVDGLEVVAVLGLFALLYLRDLRRDRFPVPPPSYQQPTVIIQRRVGCFGRFLFGFIIAIIVIIGLSRPS
jgi:hypothetical protein